MAKHHNLQELPEGQAIFGVFAIVGEEPANCRYIGEAENLQQAVKELFENNDSKGLQKFMQGPWIKMLQFKCMPGSSRQERQQAMKIWEQQYNPNIDEKGEYPGYYDNV